MVTVLTFLAVFFILLAIRESLYASRRQVEERLQQMTVQPGKTEVAGAVKKRRSFVWLREIITGFKPARGFVERLEDRLCQADILLKAEEFLILTVGATVLTGLIGYATTHKVAGGLIGLFFGLALPNLALRMAQNRRLKAFDAQVADCIVIMANTLRAGFGFMQAMDVVRREMGPPISKEFGRALTEINLGISTEEALNNLVKRVKSEDMDLVVTAMIIQRSVGGNLASILDTIAETIRERVRLKGEIKALTAQGRISGMIIGFMPFALALMLYFVNPEYILMLFQNKLGMVMLTVAGAGELIGLFLIKKIVDIKV